jgi:hypothetical protein
MRTRKRKVVKIDDYAVEQRKTARLQTFKKWIEKSLEKNWVYSNPAFDE